MSELRALIREILAEEVAALRAGAAEGGPQLERVRVADEAALTEFAQSLLRRAADPAFAEAVRAGRLRFAPEVGAAVHSPTGGYAAAPAPAFSAPVPAAASAPVVVTLPPSAPELAKGLVSERDIAALPEDTRRLRLRRTACLTPLARDEARRRGIRIERTLP